MLRSASFPIIFPNDLAEKKPLGPPHTRLSAANRWDWAKLAPPEGGSDVQLDIT